MLKQAWKKEYANAKKRELNSMYFYDLYKIRNFFE